MGKRNKRARTILKKMSILGEEISLETARRYGIEKKVRADLDRRQAIIDEENRIKAEAKAKLLAEEKAKAEAKKKKEAEAKKKAAPKKRASKKKVEAKDKE
jgi:membrane protein involved in colicin uptake